MTAFSKLALAGGLVAINGVLADDKSQVQPGDSVIGIDLGTTYSCVGIYKNQNVEIIPNNLGNRITPSYAFFPTDGDDEYVKVGEAAKSQVVIQPEQTVFDVKRLIGRRFNEKT